MHHSLVTSTCNPLEYKMGNPILYLLYQYLWESPSEYKGLIYMGVKQGNTTQEQE